MMPLEDLCLTCGYWVATIGGQCDLCFDGDPSSGLEACVVAAALVWRRSLIPNTTTAGAPATAALVDAVDCLLHETSTSAGTGNDASALGARARRQPLPAEESP